MLPPKLEAARLKPLAKYFDEMIDEFGYEPSPDELRQIIDSDIQRLVTAKQEFKRQSDLVLP